MRILNISIEFTNRSDVDFYFPDPRADASFVPVTGHLTMEILEESGGFSLLKEIDMLTYLA